MKALLTLPRKPILNSINKSLIYSLAESYLCVLIQIASSMIIARLLTPSEIGKYSIGMAALTIAHMLRDFGVGAYMVQVKELTKQDMKAVFGIGILTAWSLAAALYFARYAIAGFYHEPALVEILGWMSVNFLVIPFSSTVFPLLMREMKFHLLFYINLIPTLLSSGLSIYLAYHGYSYMSLVWGSLANISLVVVMATCLRPRYSFVLPSLKGSLHILAFGSKTSLTNIVAQIGNSTAELMIGKSLGFASVALFSKAQTLTDMFSHQFLGAIMKVYFPAIAQRYRDELPLNSAYADSTVYITAFAFPFFGFMALYAEEIILIMFGNQWLASAELIRILALGGCLYAITAFAPNTINAIGKPGLLLRVQLFVQCFRIGVTLPAAFMSLSMVAWAQTVTFGMSLFIYLPVLSYLIQLNAWRLLVRIFAANLIMAALALAIPFAIKHYLEVQGLPTVGLLALAGSSFALSWVVALFMTHNPLAGQFMKMLGKKP